MKLFTVICGNLIVENAIEQTSMLEHILFKVIHFEYRLKNMQTSFWASEYGRNVDGMMVLWLFQL